MITISLPSCVHTGSFSDVTGAFEGLHELDEGVYGSERLSIAQVDTDAPNAFVTTEEFQVGSSGFSKELLFELCVVFNSEGYRDARAILMRNAILVEAFRAVDTVVNRG